MAVAAESMLMLLEKSWPDTHSKGDDSAQAERSQGVSAAVIAEGIDGASAWARCEAAAAAAWIQAAGNVLDHEAKQVCCDGEGRTSEPNSDL